MTEHIKLLVMIPVYNEADNIGRVVDEIRKHLPADDILIINDGSTDATLSIAQKLDVQVLSLPYNLGIGGAVQAGFLAAIADGYDLVIRLDGDGQHDPAYLHDLIEVVLSGNADVAIGSRYVTGKGYQASIYRAVGIRLFAYVVSLLTKQKFTDTTSGFQAINRESFTFLAAYLPTDYPEIEGLVLLNRAGFSVKEIPVVMRPRQYGQSSITTLRSVYYIFKVLLAILIEMLRKPIKRGDING